MKIQLYLVKSKAATLVIIDEREIKIDADQQKTCVEG